VSAEDSESEENLCDVFELHPPWMRDFIDPIPGSGDDAQVLQQCLKPAGENWSFNPKDSTSSASRYIFVGLVFYVLVLRLLLLLSR
jgi:predicted methyltransferase